ncbi:MAG TPA: hypothetical protein VIM19_05620 [Actinomycetes bacterium]
MYQPNGRDAGLRRVKTVTGGVAALALVGTGVAGITAFRHDQSVAVASSTVTSGATTTTSPTTGSSATSSSGLSAPGTPVTQAPTTSAPVAKSSGS